MMGHGKGLHMVTWILVVVGCLNWLLEGVFSWGVGDFLGSGVAKIVYILVGLSAIYEIVIHSKSCRYCRPSGDLPQGDKPSGMGQQS